MSNKHKIWKCSSCDATNTENETTCRACLNLKCIQTHVILTKKTYAILIIGYIRQLSNSFHLNIPYDIMQIIDKLVPKLDEWNHKLSDSRLEINSETHSVKRIDVLCGEWYNGYGTQQINPSEYVHNIADIKNDYLIIESWKLNFLSLHASKTIMVGIIAHSQIDNVTDYFCCAGYGYGLYGANQQTYHYYHSYDKPHEIKTLSNITFEQGKTVEILLFVKKNDCKYCCLGYRDIGDIEVAFDQLDMHQSYHFAVSFFDPNDDVQFV